jgi:5-methylcytosine-specific restriction protein A
MPMAPKSPCLHPGCPALVSRGDKGRCPAHRKAYEKGIDRNRGTATARGYNSRWTRFRAWYLNAHPICACGCGRAAQEIHHLRPVTGPDDPNFYGENNLVSLTKECHSRETMRTLNEQRRA